MSFMNCPPTPLTPHLSHGGTSSEPELMTGGPLSASATRVLRSSELLGQQREVLIQHGHDTYRLRLTAQGKLILTK